MRLLGRLESKKAGIYLSLTSLLLLLGDCQGQTWWTYVHGKAGYNPSLTCINIRAKHVEEACKRPAG